MPEPVETVETADGRTLTGRLVSDPAGNLSFRVTGADEAIGESSLRSWTADRAKTRRTAGTPPYRFSLAPYGRISGRLNGLEKRGVSITPDGATRSLLVAPGGISAISQRPGESQVLREPFETLDLSRWSQGGTPVVAIDPHLVDEKALQLPSGGNSLTTRLAEDFHSGRLELAFFDDAKRRDGHRWFVDLTFRKPNSELATVRVVLGWNEATLAVETPGGPALNVQPLVRKPGWRRLSIKFDEKHVLISVDGDELAHGQGLGGVVFELRLASEIVGTNPEGERSVAIIDDLSLVRFAEPSPRSEIDPAQDEVRLTTGDQLFGKVASSDADRVTFEVDKHEMVMPWSQISSIHFERRAGESKPIVGRWARVDWQVVEPGQDPAAWDEVEGAIVSLDERSLVMEVPYVGRMTLPRDGLRRMEFLSRGGRLVIDQTAHHLGDRSVEDLDPPQPGASPFDLAFTLPDAAVDAPMIALDLLQVTGVEGTPIYSELVKKGELLTRLSLNGQDLGDLNRHITSRNETPLRVRVPVPKGILRKGANTLRISQTGTKDEPAQRDNLGILCIAIEFPTPKALVP